MTFAALRRSPVSRQLEAYEETWKQDHHEAMECRDWEEAIAFGLAVRRFLREREEHWREQVFRGVVPFSKEDDRDHQLRLAWWLDITEQALRERIAELERSLGRVEGAADLRLTAEEGRKALLAWKSPSLSRAVGLREMTLTPEAGAELDRILEEAKTNPPPPLTGSKMQVMSLEEYRALRKPS